MKYGHFGPCSLEYLLWDDIGQDLIMKFVVCTSFVVMRGRLEFVFFFFFSTIMYAKWIMDYVAYCILAANFQGTCMYFVCGSGSKVLYTAN